MIYLTKSKRQSRNEADQVACRDRFQSLSVTVKLVFHIGLGLFGSNQMNSDKPTLTDC